LVSYENLTEMTLNMKLLVRMWNF